jgi:sec-independent protein translocase protein TatB
VFNLSGSEIVFLLLIALVVLGPEKLPEAVRKFGKTYGEFKKMTSGFQSELKTALDEPMREMRETADAFKKAASFDFDASDTPTPEVAETPQVAEAPAPPEVAEAPQVAEAPTTPEVAEAPQVAEIAEVPIERAPGPNFASAAPRKPETVEETASE